MSKTSNPIRGLFADNGGASLIELALVAPVLVVLFAGMVDISRVVAARLDLEQAAQRTTDLALAKRPTSDDGTYLKNEAASAAGVPATDATVEIFLECNGAKQAAFSGDCPAGQTRARFASVSIDRTVPMMFDWGAMSRMAGSNILPSSITVTGDSVVRFQ